MSGYDYKGQLYDITFNKAQLIKTFEIMTYWAFAMEGRTTTKTLLSGSYSFPIIHSIYKQLDENRCCSWKQYKVMEKYWFKWYIYKSSLMKYGKMDDIEIDEDEREVCGFHPKMTEKEFDKIMKHNM
tara:strand:+ start:3499 stop:3879 length:381 start_codon:yes stop_codon:yes gene_type:complete